MSLIDISESVIELKCQECNYHLPMPYHCKKPMNLVNKKLICWKGDHEPCCNSDASFPVPQHHDKPLILAV